MKHSDLVKAVKHKLKKTTRNDHHIVYQILTHVERLQATGEGEEILEHYLANETWYLGRVFYYNGKIYDFNNMPVEKWSKANRHNLWFEVKSFSHLNRPWKK
tara:strand:- start:199 stop:504 length:306 start_codon:yes stop_codon:yes gene_type:complete